MYINSMIKKDLIDIGAVRIFPKPLHPGDHTAIIAASSPISEQGLETAVKSIEFLGLRPVIMPSCECASSRPWLAADDRRRAADITSALADPHVRGIFFARGGYGSARIVPYIDFELFRRFPKMLLGSSDLTFLLNAVSARSGLVTFHGPMPSVDGGYGGLDDVSLAALCAAVLGRAAGMRSRGASYGTAAVRNVYEAAAARRSLLRSPAAGTRPGLLCGLRLNTAASSAAILLFCALCSAHRMSRILTMPPFFLKI